MRAMKFRCPNPKCHVTLSIPQTMQGRQVRCADCGQSFPAPFKVVATRTKISTGKSRIRKAA